MDALWRYNITFIHVHITLYPPFLQICLRVTTSLFFPLGLVHTAQFTPVTTQLSLPKRANKFHLKHQKPKLEVALSFKEEFHSRVLVHGEVADVYHGFRRMKRSLTKRAGTCHSSGTLESVRVLSLLSATGCFFWYHSSKRTHRASLSLHIKGNWRAFKHTSPSSHDTTSSPSYISLTQL